ncbi:DNA integrity scanning protein DisA nucleotide-binding domain protein [Mycoplasma sp. 2045]|uniref:diadenylate cyclase n=1 Tax=unclassified Mycoplasma TaxID=2683645 RepID=UPI00211C2944|nr:MULTISPECIES: DNA integrity scanning protein DisA nucleotide-binding domain protein [unclassified Mycoplasma]MEA4134266.1 DNA integrity scanning protein DisA nucleotide-binding domain protein [Mycoplasma sp. 2704]MEA4162602.1 DNA integrity scanning protein DisA nucleotide-binding domain protein [Mycoplasma sp. 4404]MEA4190902.1 DNA integrity scanning protein DisA nucleotide-binding domain protein [Mycoplasma sp. 2248]MEA4206192.1 DNA integrity scanning protein DisA nucleotide-binding domain 
MNVVAIISLVIGCLTFIAILGLLGYFLKPMISTFVGNKIRKSKYEKLGKSSQIRLINQLRETVDYLSKNKIGALITIENNDNIDNLRTDGVVVNANISSSLLISIFNKTSPLHDGAVVIRDNKIYYAATFYKITKRSFEANYGSRHRAALGISEQSDATTIVVSEENGQIKIIKNGAMIDTELDHFQEDLIKYLSE